MVRNFILAEAIITAVFCIPVIIFFRSKPLTPPSKSQTNYESPTLKECLKLMFKNKEFIKFLITFTCVLGYFNLYGTIANEYFEIYGLTLLQTSIVSGVANVLAIIGSLVVSAILDKYKNYKTFFVLLIIIGTIAHICMTIFSEVVDKDYTFYVVVVCWTVCSISIIPIYTASMDFVCEITYPVGESISGGLIMVCSQISGVISILICDAFMDNLPKLKYLPNCFGALFLVISIFSVMFIEPKLNRLAKDKGIAIDDGVPNKEEKLINTDSLQSS